MLRFVTVRTIIARWTLMRHFDAVQRLLLKACFNEREVRIDRAFVGAAKHPVARITTHASAKTPRFAVGERGK